MNCPYCNQPAQQSPHYFICQHCYGSPLWANWENISSQLKLTDLFVEFTLQDKEIRYFPNSNQIFIIYSEKIPLRLNWHDLVTPNNLNETLQRINKLLLFL